MREQLLKGVEAIKLAYLSKTPAVWLVAEDREVASQIVEAFVCEHYGSFRDERAVGCPVNLERFSNTIKDKAHRSTISYKWIDQEAANEKEYLILTKDLEEFISVYLHLNTEKIVQPMPADHLEKVQKSLVIIASPALPKHSWINKYIEVIYVDPLTDKEIQHAILSGLENRQIVVREQERIGQLVVSLRGFSERQLEQTILRCVIAGYFDGDEADWGAIFHTVRKMKRQMLEGFRGLKWIDLKIENSLPTKRESLHGSLGEITRWLDVRRDIYKDTKAAIRAGYDIPKGVLITGIPGTGKSMMAKRAAQMLDLPLIALDMGELQEGLVGASEQHMEQALRMVEAMAPCVLWIDEIEKAFSGSNSGQSDGGVMRRMFGKFLTWMQEKSAPCFVFATSNDISKLPPELFRSERFDDKFFSFMPMLDECASIFASLVKAENVRHQKSAEDEDEDCLFSPELEDPLTWKSFLNDLVPAVEMDGNHWKDGKMPQCKLFTGADISMLIKLVKFNLLNAYGQSARLLKRTAVFNEAKLLLRDFMPYGETNLRDIATCFLTLVKNRFRPASTGIVVSFDDYDTSQGEMHYQEKYSTPYDRALHASIVGAVNFFGKEKKYENQ